MNTDLIQRPSAPRRPLLCLPGALVLAMTIAGCAQKPPGCGEPKTLETLQDLVVEQVKKRLRPTGQDDPDKVLDTYLGRIKAELLHVVSEGYNADAKKYSCKATMRLTVPDYPVDEAPITYVSQLTETTGQSGKKESMVEALGLHELLETAKVRADMHYRKNRYSGNWNGTYSCTGIDGSESGPQGPYKQDVTLVGNGVRGKLDRTTKGGGIESIEGTIYGQVFLEGKGKNSADDYWVTKFEGAIEGRQMTAKGTIALPFDPRTMTTPQVLRNCQLDLTQEARKQ